MDPLTYILAGAVGAKAVESISTRLYTWYKGSNIPNPVIIQQEVVKEIKTMAPSDTPSGREFLDAILERKASLRKVTRTASLPPEPTGMAKIMVERRKSLREDASDSEEEEKA